MGDDKDPTQRSSQPEPDEWGFLWKAADRSNKSWLITGPIYAVVSNWKALAAIGAIVIWWNSPKVTAAIAAYFGVGL